MYIKSLALLTISVLLLISCKKNDDASIDFQKESEHLTRKWKVQQAFKNSTGNKSDNGEDVSYDWNSFSIEFRKLHSFEIFDYSPDSSSCIIESGNWQLDNDGLILLQGTEKMVDFTGNQIIHEGATEQHWMRKKNKNNELWIWIETSYYPGTGVFLMMSPY